MRTGEQHEVECSDLDDSGAGIASVDGGVGPARESRRVHVKGLLPSEKAVVTIEHVSPHGAHDAWARCDRLLTKSALRAEPVCPSYGACGGCTLQHLDYEAQLAWKRARVAQAFANLPDVTVEPCVPSPRTIGYRNQAKYVYGPAPATSRGKKAILGAYAPRSHDLVDLAGCRLVEPVLDDVARAAHDVFEERSVQPFDEKRRTGVLRYVALRSSAAGEVLVTLVTSRADWPDGGDVAGALTRRCPNVVGVVQNINPNHGNALYGDQERVLTGRAHIEDVVGDVRVRLSSRSFFQINREVAAFAYARIRDAVAAMTPVDRVIDAYAGVGGIALTLARLAGEIVALEENAAATRAAEERARAEPHSGANIRFVTADAGALLSSLPPAEVVVLNPPRSGCGVDVRVAVARMRPRLVAYLSCDPGTLARDLEFFHRHELLAASLLPLDMLPHTTHVEALALLFPTTGGARTSSSLAP
jgi:23S rRNA (uracil-5-)-methyltransferase RumA